MLLPALALILASATDPSAIALKVVSIDFAYPYYGEPGNTCQRGNVFIRAIQDPNGAKTPVVVRMTGSAGLTPGSEAVLEVQRAGKGTDGTPVYCSDGRRAAAPSPVTNPSQPTLVAAQPLTQPAAAQPVTTQPAPVKTAAAQPAAVQPAAQPPAAQPTAAQPAAAQPTAAQPAAAQPTATKTAAAQPAPEQPSPAPTAAAQPATTTSRCSVHLFNVIKKALTDNTFGPSEFDPESAIGLPEPVNCALARSRVTNVLLLKMVKERHVAPDTVVGAEWEPGSRWERDGDTQRRTVKVYLGE